MVEFETAKFVVAVAVEIAVEFAVEVAVAVEAVVLPVVFADIENRLVALVKALGIVRLCVSEVSVLTVWLVAHCFLFYSYPNNHFE